MSAGTLALLGLVLPIAPIAAPYSGALQEIACVLSPRAEGGGDLVAGLAGSWRLGSTGLSLHGELTAAYTPGRTSFPLLSEPSALFRL